VIVPKLRYLTSPDFDPEKGPNCLEGEALYVPLSAIFGPSDSEGEESFEFVVCNPKGLEHELAKGAFFVRHHIIVTDYKHAELKNLIEALGRRCMAETWTLAAEKLSRYGYWEFEDYSDT
jgi:hypothetical protein